jgi:hypothetical protein
MVTFIIICITIIVPIYVGNKFKNIAQENSKGYDIKMLQCDVHYDIDVRMRDLGYGSKRLATATVSRNELPTKS